MKEQIVKVAEKYGFNLEFRAKKIFESLGYEVNINQLYGIEKQQVEIDLVCSFREVQYVIECKGTDASGHLILVKAPAGSFTDEVFKRRVINSSEWRLAGYKHIKACPEHENLFFTTTGDFFLPKNKNDLQKMSKNDDGNNFFKAQSQINDALVALSQGTPTDLTVLKPLIVTNASIWVIDYCEDIPQVQKYCWTLHQVRESNELGLDQKSFMVPVVNIRYLEDFIRQSTNRTIDTGQYNLCLKVDEASATNRDENVT